MKSSFELAMERLGGPLKKLSEKQKAKIAEIDSKYKAKIAEAELMAQARIRKSEGNPAAIEQIQNDLVVEFASLRSKREKEKNTVREEK